ncbi:c2 calcium-dependent membrane targeting [Anaeramoeba ignava]|uniref:C2 calcium-dependent membrane targeting n=1 Tax=Anaeramoeba ignava TaxID=1746090 RepID=A0A9Q0R9K6_ANAIG|nr:c2 calcium-dependent membrane targeting [Anaeramoeba ignava]
MSLKIDPKYIDGRGRADFQIQVHLIECRDLKGRGSSAMSDPVCFVTVDKKTQKTHVFKNTLSCTFDHLMFFQSKWKPSEFDHKKVLIQVFDSNTIRRNVLIGQYELDPSFVHGEPNHEIWHRWYLGPGDQPPTHENDGIDDEEVEDTQDLQKLILRPPQLDVTGYHLKVYCYRAEDLPKMDTFGKADPFIQVRFAGNPLIRTEVKKKTLTPIWNEMLRLPVYTPTLANMIEIELYDWERATKDNDLISSTYFRFTDVQLEAVNARWVNFYGPPKGNIRTLFKKGHTEETEYKGRALIALEAELATEPSLNKDPTEAPRDPPKQQYILRLDLFEGSEFDTNALEKCFVEITIGKHVARSKTMSTKKGAISWYEQLKDLVVEFPVDVEQVPDIFLNVYFKNKLLGKARVGYVRYKFSEALSGGKEPLWSMLEGDPKSPVYKQDSVAGFLLHRLEVGPAAQLSRIPRQKLAKPPMRRYELRAHIYQGRDLPPADKTGFSDPYCVVRFGSASKKTARKEETLYPTWYETVTLVADMPEPLTLAPDVVVMCYDWDQVTSDDFLGRFSVTTHEIGKRFPSAPRWYKLWVDDPNVVYGEVLASFQLIPLEEAGLFPKPPLQPELKPCLLQISAVGLRSLLPFRMSKIKQPLAEFDCSQGTVKTNKERKKFIFSTDAVSKPSGANPNYLKVFRIPVQIPLNHIFASSVMIRVFDKRSLGKTLVATGAISLAQFIPWANVPLENVNLPPIVDTIPGATVDGIVVDEDDLKDPDKALDAVVVQRDLVPSNIEETNELILSPIIFDNEADDDGIHGLRTIPEVRDQFPDEFIEEKEEEFDDSYQDPKKGRERSTYELEHTFKNIPFLEYELTRGKVRGLSFFEKMFRDKSRNPNAKRVVGKFKGNFKIYEETDTSKIETAPDLLEMFRPQRMVVRAYILRGMSLVPKDSNGSSDPYIVISTGKSKEMTIKDRKNYKKRTLRPEFFKCYELPCVIPGNSDLTISVFDRDTVSSDELIGTTVVDLENRFFADEWKALNPKPVEYRTLWAPTSTNPQGKLEMWIEIMTEEEARNTPQTPLEPPKQENFEIRAVAWNTKDVVFKDKNMSDIFVTCQLNEGKRQRSDIHWRSTDGKGSFNWRFVFPVVLPNRVPRIKFQLWDEDILNPNDSIGESLINLKAFFRKAYKLKSKQSIKRQWIDLLHPNFDGKQGSLELQIDIVTEAEALATPVGKGRKDPNRDPFLDKPDRPFSSFAPWRLDKYFKIGWKKYRGKVLCCLCSCVICCIVILIIVLKVTIL